MKFIRTKRSKVFKILFFIYCVTSSTMTMTMKIKFNKIINQNHIIQHVFNYYYYEIRYKTYFSVEHKIRWFLLESLDGLWLVAIPNCKSS